MLFVVSFDVLFSVLRLIMTLAPNARTHAQTERKGGAKRYAVEGETLNTTISEIGSSEWGARLRGLNNLQTFVEEHTDVRFA